MPVRIAQERPRIVMAVGHLHSTESSTEITHELQLSILLPSNLPNRQSRLATLIDDLGSELQRDDSYLWASRIPTTPISPVFGTGQQTVLSSRKWLQTYLSDWQAFENHGLKRYLTAFHFSHKDQVKLVSVKDFSKEEIDGERLKARFQVCISSGDSHRISLRSMPDDGGQQLECGHGGQLSDVLPSLFGHNIAVQSGGASESVRPDQ